LHHGDVRVELHHPGIPAHTAGDLIAWLPDRRVLFTGDLLFNQVTPLVFMGSVEGALQSLDWMALFRPDHIVPGHGPLISGGRLAEVLDTHRAYYQMLLTTARAGLRAGFSPLDAAFRCELGKFAGLPDSERIVLNLHRAYADITGAELDVIQAFTDTVTFNGGPMSTAV
jgi:cyclase